MKITRYRDMTRYERKWFLKFTAGYVIAAVGLVVFALLATSPFPRDHIPWQVTVGGIGVMITSAGAACYGLFILALVTGPQKQEKK